MNTTITITIFIFLFVLFSLTIPILLFLGFDLKNIIPIITPIFVALIALLSNQWGIYLNKQYDVKIYVRKKNIEDIEKSINTLENIHKEFFKLFQDYNNLRFCPEIMQAFFSPELYPQIRAGKSSELNKVVRELGLVYFSNYLIFNEATKNIYSEIISSNIQASLENFWEEIYSRQIILNKNIVMREVLPNYFENIDKLTTNFLTSILSMASSLKEQKNNLLESLNTIQ